MTDNLPPLQLAEMFEKTAYNIANRIYTRLKQKMLKADLQIYDITISKRSIHCIAYANDKISSIDDSKDPSKALKHLNDDGKIRCLKLHIKKTK